MRLVLLMAALAAAAPAQNELANALRKGVVSEETGKDLTIAMGMYRNVVAAFDQERKAAAQALFAVAEWHRAGGRTVQSQAAYARVVEEFFDLSSLMHPSLRQLPVSYQPRVRSGGEDQARARQSLRALLNTRHELAEGNREAQMERYNLGVVQRVDAIRAAAQAAKAQRDVVAYDIWLAESALPAGKLRSAGAGAPVEPARLEGPAGQVALFDRFLADRPAAAAALFRLAECYRKQGTAFLAEPLYARIINEFADQTSLVSRSRAGLPPRPGPDMAELRKRYRATLERELNLSVSLMEYVKREVELGQLSSLDTYSPQQQLTEIRAKLAAWDAGLLKPELPFSIGR